MAQIHETEQQLLSHVWGDFYSYILYIQLAAVTFWSLLSCAQSISGERERRTWDFQRASRLSAGELLIGKLFGEPVLAYFILICCIPLTVVAGLLGEAGWRRIGMAYLLISAGAVFIGLVGLSVSNVLESRSRGIGLIGIFALYLIIAFGSQITAGTSFPGLGGFSPVIGLMAILQGSVYSSRATIFGSQVPWLILSLLLYTSFGAWLALILVRTLKKDYDQMLVLARWQVVALAAFIDLTLYALFSPRLWYRPDPREFANYMGWVNGIVMFVTGLAMLTNPERLRFWWRKRKSGLSIFSDDGLAWPWLAISTVAAYALMVWGMFTWKADIGFNKEGLLIGLILYTIIGIFVIRDIFFLQWCRLTRLRAPVVKGLMYIGLYYAAVGVIGVVLSISSEARAQSLYSVLTPAGPFYIRTLTSADAKSQFLLLVLCVTVQIVILSYIFWVVRTRLREHSVQ